MLGGYHDFCQIPSRRGESGSPSYFFSDTAVKGMPSSTTLSRQTRHGYIYMIQKQSPSPLFGEGQVPLHRKKRVSLNRRENRYTSCSVTGEGWHCAMLCLQNVPSMLTIIQRYSCWVEIILLILTSKQMINLCNDFAHTHGFVKFFLRSKFFPFRVDPFFRGTEFIDKQTRSPENCLASKKAEKSTRCIHSP